MLHAVGFSFTKIYHKLKAIIIMRAIDEFVWLKHRFIPVYRNGIPAKAEWRKRFFGVIWHLFYFNWNYQSNYKSGIFIFNHSTWLQLHYDLGYD